MGKQRGQNLQRLQGESYNKGLKNHMANYGGSIQSSRECPEVRLEKWTGGKIVEYIVCYGKHLIFILSVMGSLFFQLY